MAGAAFLDEIEGRLRLAEGDPAGAIEPLRRVVSAAEEIGFLLVELRARVLAARALGASGQAEEAEHELRRVVGDADRLDAQRIRAEAEEAAEKVGIDIPEAVGSPARDGQASRTIALGERLVTSMFADIRGYSRVTAEARPDELADRMAALYRFAKNTVERHEGIVDKFAGDAVMDTFNVSGGRTDHAVKALEAALTLRDRTTLMKLPLGIGIAVGPAVVSRASSDENLAVRGVATNLAARLQAMAAESEILLSEDAYRRVRDWLQERGMGAEREELSIKGFDGPQVAYRIGSP